MRETFWLRSDDLNVGYLPAETGLFVGMVCGAETSKQTGEPTNFFRLRISWNSFLRTFSPAALYHQPHSGTKHWPFILLSRQARGVAAIIGLIHWWVRKKQVLISQLGPVTRFTNIRLATFRSRQNPRLSWWRGSIHLPQQLLSLSLCISCCSSLSPPRALSSCHYGLLDLTFGSAYLILFTSFPDLKNMKTISQSVIFRMCVNTRIHNLSHCNICVLSLLLATLWSAVLNGKTTTLTWIFPWG